MLNSTSLNCEWTAHNRGVVCVKCKAVRPYARNRPCPSKRADSRRDPLACVHFLGFTGAETEAKCGGCQSAKAMTALAECELFGLVTPISVAKDKTIRACKGCERYEAKPPP